ncbi:MAG TPA: STAS domain-containing protein [Nakamurella sp.]|jgi:anti-anti-sigma factor|nr:STAS domain-containing protein [Nakamurella sp.]
MTDAGDGNFESEQPSGFLVQVGARADGTPTVTAAGAIDLLTAPPLADAIRDAQQGASAVLVDLRRVDFLGSAGLSVLVDAAKRAGESGGRLAIVATTHAVVHALEVTGLDSVLHLFGDPDEAAAFLATNSTTGA